LDTGDWTENDFDQVYSLSRKISAEIIELRREFEQQ
jgi:hypothetical protein